MHNKFTSFKMYLQFLSPFELIFEIDLFIDELIHNNHPSNNANKKYSRLKQLKKLKHDILLKL